MSRRSPRTFKELLRSLYIWHRWIGLAAVPWLLVVVASGFALNHVESLQLDDHFIASPSILRSYGINVSGGVSGIRTSAGWVSEHRGRLYLDTVAIADVEGSLIAAAAGDLLVAATENSWLLATADGQLIERHPTKTLPDTPLALAIQGGELLMQGRLARWRSSDTGLSWRIDKPLQALPAPTITAVPEPLAKAIQTDSIQRRISWARFLGDLHSGRLFGTFGVLVTDLLGVLLLLLAASGPILWWRQHRARRRRRTDMERND